MLSAY